MSIQVLVETSARHVHVTQEVLETLFGKGYELTKKKDLSQPGQFASNERVQVIGPKSSFPAVSILGPVRPETQVELSASDARSIGVTHRAVSQATSQEAELASSSVLPVRLSSARALSLQSVTFMQHPRTPKNSASRIRRSFPSRSSRTVVHSFSAM